MGVILNLCLDIREFHPSPHTGGGNPITVKLQELGNKLLPTLVGVILTVKVEKDIDLYFSPHWWG